MGRNSLSAGLSAALLLAAAALPARADMVTLDCSSPSWSNAWSPPKHDLYAIDYSAGTVRHYIIDDDTKLWFDKTSTANIADSTIDWSEEVRYTSGNVITTFSLGRYTGTLTAKVYDPTMSPPNMTVSDPCHPWTPPQRQRQF